MGPAEREWRLSKVGGGSHHATARIVAGGQLIERGGDEEREGLVHVDAQSPATRDKGEVAARPQAGLNGAEQRVGLEQPVDVFRVDPIRHGHGQDRVIRTAAGDGFEHLDFRRALRHGHGRGEPPSERKQEPHRPPHPPSGGCSGRSICVLVIHQSDEGSTERARRGSIIGKRRRGHGFRAQGRRGCRG